MLSMLCELSCYIFDDNLYNGNNYVVKVVLVVVLYI